MPSGVRLFVFPAASSALQRLPGTMRTMSHPQLPPDASILQLAMGRWISQSLSVAARVNVADLIGDGEKSADELASATGSNRGALYRVLRALASVGVFRETSSGTFANTDVSSALRTDSPNSMRNIAMMFNDPWQFDNWGRLGDCVATGKSGPELNGVGLFDQIGGNPEALKVFQGAMSDMSRGASKAVLASYDFSGVSTLADIAGGHGLLLTDIMRSRPGMKGILFDRPEVIKGAAAGSYVRGLEDALTLVPGDFFESVPSGADAYMMKHILHDWSDDLSVKILANIRKVVPTDGKLLLVEAVIPPGNDPHPAKWIDIEMLVNPGGLERTAEEWTAVLAGGGFRVTRIISTPSLFSIVEAAPA